MNAVADAIFARIVACGPMTFAAFMEAALYGPGGYYARPGRRIGPDGDFYTSPLVHPAFGALLAGQIREIWLQAGRPRPFRILECGGGRGTLAADILHAWADGAPDLLEAAAYELADWRDPRAEPGAPAILARVAFRPASAGLPANFAGVVLANELLDAMPVHLVTRTGRGLQELYVDRDDGGLALVPGAMSSARVAAATAGWATAMPEGGRAEVGLVARDWCERLGAAMDRGVALIIDYGAERSELLARPGGTLRGYRRHRFLAGPLEHAGEADLTCHVDFTAVKAACERAGLRLAGETSQAEFLGRLGIDRIRDALAAAPLPPPAREANLANLHELVAPAGLGSFRVLALARAFDARLTGFTPGGTAEPLCAPALTRRHMTLWGGPGSSASGGRRLLVVEAADLD